MNYVIIGNSAAGIAAAEAIRRADAAGKITVVSDEPYHTYGRPLISYYLLGSTDRQRMLYRPADFYEKLGIGTRFGARAARIDPAKKKVFPTTNCSSRRARGPSCRPPRGWTACGTNSRS